MGKLSGGRFGAAQAITVLMGMLLVAATSAKAQTYRVLYSLLGVPDGAGPYAALLLDPSGSLYGTTVNGGTYDAGAVFELDRAGQETVLYSFTGGADGGYPIASLVRDLSGNIYGTSSRSNGFYGPFGTVFMLDLRGKETMLHGFYFTDGEYPYGGLIRAGSSVYGTTMQGSNPACNSGYGCGTVYKMDGTGKVTVLHSFAGGSDGEFPVAGLVHDAAENLYGTTESGGDTSCSALVGSVGCGTVFKVDAGGKETVLYAFTGGPDGAAPTGRPLRDASGDLYGTTYYGGGGAACGSLGCGTVFKLDATGKETVLHSFSGMDGANPYAGLIEDPAGNLYGTTHGGGASDNGTVFRLDTTGVETVLHSFTGGLDGGHPYAGLVRDAAGNLYGTTFDGGAHFDGVVFKLKP